MSLVAAEDFDFIPAPVVAMAALCNGLRASSSYL
jgi:hypothetical protein